MPSAARNRIFAAPRPPRLPRRRPVVLSTGAGFAPGGRGARVAAKIRAPRPPDSPGAKGSAGGPGGTGRPVGCMVLSGGFADLPCCVSFRRRAPRPSCAPAPRGGGRRSGAGSASVGCVVPSAASAPRALSFPRSSGRPHVLVASPRHDRNTALSDRWSALEGQEDKEDKTIRQAHKAAQRPTERRIGRVTPAAILSATTGKSYLSG